MNSLACPMTSISAACSMTKILPTTTTSANACGVNLTTAADSKSLLKSVQQIISTVTVSAVANPAAPVSVAPVAIPAQVIQPAAPVVSAPLAAAPIVPAQLVPAISPVATGVAPTATATSVTIGIPPASGPQLTSVGKKMPRGINFLEVAPMTVSGTVYYVISNTAQI